MNNAIYTNAAALKSHTVHWVGDTLKWSARCGGCLMWTRDGADWSSQDEGMFPTADSAEESLAAYERMGVWVNWDSVNSCDVVGGDP